MAGSAVDPEPLLAALEHRVDRPGTGLSRRACPRLAGVEKLVGRIRPVRAGRARGTVPATSGRADVPSSKNELASSGSYRGCSYISLRQPGRATRNRARTTSERGCPDRLASGRPCVVPTMSRLILESPCSSRRSIKRDHGDRPGLCSSRNRRASSTSNERVAGLEAEEEPVARRQREARHVEDRVMRPGQSVEPEHAEDRRQRREQHGHLERDRDERRPAIEAAGRRRRSDSGPPPRTTA